MFYFTRGSSRLFKKTFWQHKLLPLLMTVLSIDYLAIAGLGQTPVTAKQESPTIRVTTRLVQVNVIVQDKKGNPVTDLTREDFTLLERGQEQEIRVFSIESSKALPARSTPLPPNTYSNRMDVHGNTPTSVTVILLDGLNTSFQDQTYAKQQVVKFLQQLQPQDRVAIYTLGQGLKVIHDFTSDSAQLLAALARYKGRLSHELQASEAVESDGTTLSPPEGSSDPGAEIDAWLRAADQRMSDFYTQRRVERTVNALEAIANHLARLPGRKNLIWVSGSFPFSINLDTMPSAANPSPDRRVFNAEVDRAARALNNANLAIYPVDARGLIGAFGPNASMGRSGTFSRAPNVPTFPTKAVWATHESMEILAERTGGRAYYNTNDIKDALRQAIEDSRVTYVLGYYPTHNTWDGRFFDVKVKVKRSGVTVRHRRGYFAFADPPRDEKQRQAAINDALWSPLDSTALGLTVQLQRPDRPKIGSFKVAVRIDPYNVSLEPKGDQWVGALDFLFVQYNGKGDNVAGLNQTLDMKLKRETYERVAKDGLTFTKTLELAPDSNRLRVVVRDQITGSLGSVNVPLGLFVGKK